MKSSLTKENDSWVPETPETAFLRVLVTKMSSPVLSEICPVLYKTVKNPEQSVLVAN